MQWGLALNPNQNGDPSFCVKMGKFCEKVPLLVGVLRKKKRKEATKFCPQITTSCFFVYAHRILYIIFIKADIYYFPFHFRRLLLRRLRRLLVVVSRNVRATTREEKRETKKRSIISLRRRNNQISNKSEDFCTRIVLFCGERKKKDEHSNRGYSRANLERVFHPPGLEFQQQQR